jgi:cell fate regulator YaaT (PSP1 superfamily)
MCCLTYEHSAYVEARKRFPREGKWITTAVGRERVIAVDIWRERVVLKDEEGERRTVELAELKTEVAGESRVGGKRDRRRQEGDE